MTKKVQIGNRWIGGGCPITIQSMLNVPAQDVAGNVAQAKALEAAGCEILRVAVPTREAVRSKQAANNHLDKVQHITYLHGRGN